MRDKVKRFISILMTALMLVNLLPVGALAEGVKISNSVQGIWEKPSANVYVYVKVTGDKAGLTINPSGWYTIGKSANVPGMGIPSSVGPRSFRQVGVWPDTVLDKSRFTRHADNQKIDLDKITWTEFYIDNGADNYVPAGTYTWHMNGTIDIKQLPSVYTIKYVDYDTKELIHSYEVTGLMGQTPKKITAPDSWQENLYSFYFVNGHPKEQTVDFKKDKGELTFYYKKNTANYTVNYYLNGTTTKVAAPKKGTAALGSSVTESPITVDGYTPVSGDSKKITIKANSDENVINFYYYKNVELTANSDTKTYNGNEQTVKPGYTCSEKNVTFDNIAEPSGKGTDAGEYPVTFAKGTVGKVDTSKKYIVTEANPGTLTINKRSVTLTSGSGEKVYDGNALTNGEVTVSGDGFADGEGAMYDVTGSQTVVGSSANTFTYTLNKGTKADNYTITKAEGTLTVTAAETEVVVTITGKTDTVKYDGGKHSVEGYTVSINNSLYKETDFTFTGSKKAEGTNAGEYKMGLTESQFTNTSKNFTNVKFEVTDGYVKITPREVTLTSASDSKKYDGNALTNDTVTVGGDGFVAGEVTEIKATGSVTNVSEGEVTNAITFTKGEKFNEDNYAIEKKEGKLSIGKRSVTLTSATLIKDYDGTPLKNGDAPVKEEFGTEKAFPEGEGVTYTFTGGQTNAGSSKNMFTYAWNEGTNKDNYTIYQIEGDLVVTPIDGIKVTITGHKDTQTYDGKPHKVEGYDVKPDNLLFTEKDIKFNGEAEATGTDVRIDPYQMGLKPEQFTNTSNNFTNVEFVVEDGQIVITPRAVTLTSETASKTYDGTPLTRPNVTVSTGENEGFVEGEVTDIKATGSVTNAGSVANTITFTPNKETFKEGNYAITKTEGTLTIAKRSVLITSQSATKTYDGSALTRPAVTITGDGFVPGELAKAEATGSITKVGSTPNTIQYTTTGAFNAANYSIALSVGTLTVTEKPKPEPRRTFNLTINYVYQNGKRAAASYNRGGLKNGETFDITSPVIAGYTASETVVSGTIYNRDIKVTVIYTADGVNLDDYGVPLGLGNITMNVGDCFE